MSELNKFVEYRGMMLDENIISNLLNITNLQIQSQKFAVPLSFMSCSKSQNVAKQFLENQEYRPYEEKVRGFCAVDIENISKYSEGQKVLLRGAFFQVLRFYESKEKIDGKDSMPKMSLYANTFFWVER